MANAAKTVFVQFKMCTAFIAAFTIEKQWMTITERFISHLQLVPNFFIRHLPILVQCKIKGALRAVCPSLGNWQLGA
jgi:hypothetical protein